MSENNKSMIYKYKKWDKNTIEMIVNNELFFSNPDIFNDPFDSKCHNIFAQGSKAEWENLAKRISKLYKLPKDKEKTVYNNTIEVYNSCEGNTKNNKEANDFMIQQMEINPFIFSASKTATENLLWGHYAQAHQGICLGFATRKLTKHSQTLKVAESIQWQKNIQYNEIPFIDVKYNRISDTNNNFLEYNLISDSANYEKTIEQITIKHENWKYEQETRSLLSEKNIHDFKNKIIENQEKKIGFKIQFDRTTLKEIIFGLECSDPTRKDVVKILRNSQYNMKNITFKEIKKSDTKYELYTEDIDITKY